MHVFIHSKWLYTSMYLGSIYMEGMKKIVVLLLIEFGLVVHVHGNMYTAKESN
jgi:hypothetical protein